MFDRISKGKLTMLDQELTPLNASRSRVLTVMEPQNLGAQPPRMVGNKERRNFNLYFAFHKDIGHETGDYRDLKWEIENLIKQGHLRRFVCDGRREDRRQNR